MTHDDVTPESEARWQAWLTRGRARERRTRHRIQTSLLALLFGSAILGALFLGL